MPGICGAATCGAGAGADVDFDDDRDDDDALFDFGADALLVCGAGVGVGAATIGCDGGVAFGVRVTGFATDSAGGCNACCERSVRSRGWCADCCVYGTWLMPEGTGRLVPGRCVGASMASSVTRSDSSRNSGAIAGSILRCVETSSFP